MKQTKRAKAQPAKPKKAGTKEPLTVDAATGLADPTPAPVDLARIVDVRREMARIYRGMKAGEIEANTGSKLVWVLAQIGSMIELEEFERRIAELEERAVGGARSLPAPARTH